MKNKIKDEPEEKPIFVTSQDQANQIYEDMKNREISAFNHNYNETEKMLKEASNRLHSTKTHTLKELEDIKALITEYIGVIRTIVSTLPDRTSFKENKKFIDRNKEYNNDAIKNLETLSEVVKDRIKRRDLEQLNRLPKSLNSILSDEKLLKLRSLLIAGDYICNISESDFIYLFREQPLKVGLVSIQWKKSKVKAKKLLSVIIGENFSNPTANKCFILYKNPKDKIFDSNVKLTTSYPDIDGIIRQLK
jgi:glutaredoxin 2